jgi:hypothetical protein
VKISDLGLTIKLRNKPLKHLAGTGGYWAPEIVMKEGTYKVGLIIINNSYPRYCR